MMGKTRFKIALVPWRDPAEFVKVYNYAYSDDLAQNRWAVEQMSVWETKCWPSLPTAVEVTLLFVRSKIQDQLYEANKSLCHAQEIEMMYANSVVRFVNLLVENDQNAKTKKRISYLAAERNIPPWIVDIRHSSTHGFNPTLPMLRMAYETCMAYLEETFWRPESSRVACIRKTINDAAMTQLWQDYRIKQYEVAMQLSDAKRKKFFPAVDNILEKMDIYLSKVSTRKTFLNVLVRDFVADDVMALVADDEIMNDPQMMSCCTLPTNLQRFYIPLLHLLQKHDLIPTFLELLLLNQDKLPMKIQQTIVDLIVLFVLSLVQRHKIFEPCIVRPFVQNGVNFNMYRLLYSCVQGCSYSARLVFEKLVKDMKLSAWAQDLSAMMSIKQGKYIEHYAEERVRNQRQKRKFDITFTTEDLEEDIYEAMEEKKLRLKKNHWSLAPLNINWATVPIGHVFHPVEIPLKEEAKPEKEVIPVENDEIKYSHACEESKPVEKTQPAQFIFKELPNFSNMIYQRKEKEG